VQLCILAERIKVKITPLTELHCKRQQFSLIIIYLHYFQAAGKYRQQGKTYVVEDGDIIFFKFNAGAGLTSAKKK
jgi:ribosome-binding ATPase YchF (GTP1/OBG family)